MSALIIKTIQSSLEDAIFKQLIALNTSIPSPVIRAVVSRVSETTAASIFQDVSKLTNFELSDIPKNIIGIKNPVDIVTSNINSTGLTNNLNSIIQTQLSSQITDKLVTALESQLKLALPQDRLGIINFANIAAIIAQNVTPLINTNITSALSSITDAIFNRSITPSSITTGIESLFTQNPTTALDRIKENYDTALASTALNESRNFDINNEDNREKLTVVEKGFTDPTATYPTKEYVGQSETNKLAQGDPRGTIVTKKLKERMLGAKLPGGQAWDEPETSYRGAYPYNKVTQTESGHIIEIDDTPGSERLHIYHKSGTYVEIDPNGSVIKRTRGSSYEIIDKNGKISIAGRADISVNGACNIYVGNDANIEVEGDVNLTCHNDITAQAGGTFNLSSTEEFNITSANVNIEAYTDFNLRSGNEMFVRADKNLYTSTGENQYEETGKDLHTKVNSSLYIETTGDLYYKIGSNSVLQTGGSINFNASDNLNIDTGGIVDSHSGSASSAEPALTSKVATRSKIGILPGRKDIQPISINDPQALTLADNRSLLLEEETQTPTDYENQKVVIISEGYGTAADIDTAPVAVDSASVSSQQSEFIEADIKLKKVTQLPDNYNLSPNFTVGMLSSKAAVTRDPIKAHGSFTYGDIAYNLQTLALNILEPVKKLYPNMFVTSAFRDPGKSIATSQHPQGKGVDIQFKGATKEEYYDIAISLAKVLNYDQLILEFCNYTNNPWIHISVTSDKNRKQVLTFFNHKKHSDGLTQLA